MGNEIKTQISGGIILNFLDCTTSLMKMSFNTKLKQFSKRKFEEDGKEVKFSNLTKVLL